MADIYQDVRDFIFAFQVGHEDAMRQALKTCRDNFETYWGQKLVNVLRALHNVYYNNPTDDEDDCHEDGCCHNH